MALTNYYDIIDRLKTTLEASPFVNTVTTGDIFEIDLSKQTIFPLSHIIINNATMQDHTILFSVTVMCMDIPRIQKTDSETNKEIHTEIDIMNTQLAVANRLGEELRRGTLHRDLFELDGNVTCEPFFEKSENMLAGWSISFNVLTKNNILVC
jgi:hypothetical protein